jgi:hypothetical protein
MHDSQQICAPCFSPICAGLREVTAHAREHATHFTIAKYSHFTISSSISAFVSPIPLPRLIPTDSGDFMSDTIRVSLTLTLFPIAFPALYVFFKAADPHLKAIVGAAVFLFPCVLLLWEDLVSPNRVDSKKIERSRS